MRLRRRRRRSREKVSEKRARKEVRGKERRAPTNNNKSGGVAAKEREQTNKTQASTFLTGVRDRRLSHLKITGVVAMTRIIITLVLFLLLSRDDVASSTVVVFYRDVMPRLHATQSGEKKG
jgi:hypothetical protein